MYLRDSYQCPTLALSANYTVALGSPCFGTPAHQDNILS